MRLLLLPALALACAGCKVVEQPSGLIPRWTAAWREVASDDDESRLRDWRKTFVDALAAANSTNAAEVAKQGRLLDPDAAVGIQPLPNGLYRCRVVKLGAKAPGNLNYVAYPAFTCRVRTERNLQRLTKLNGSQRYVGLLFPGDAIHQVFLGTLVLGDERRALQYGQDQTRDVGAFLERTGPNRWRLVMPEPHFESRLDVMELVPISKEASQ